MGLLRSRGVPTGADDTQTPATARAESLLLPRIANGSPAIPVQASAEASRVSVRTHVHRGRGRPRKDDRSGYRHARARRTSSTQASTRRLPAGATRASGRAELFERFDQEFEILDRARAFEIVGDPDQAHAPGQERSARWSLLRSPDFVDALARAKRGSTSSSLTSRITCRTRRPLHIDSGSSSRPWPITC